MCLNVRNHKRLSSSLNRTVKLFLNSLANRQFGISLSFLNWFELGLGWLKLKRTYLGQIGFEAGQGLISSAKAVNT